MEATAAGADFPPWKSLVSDFFQPPVASGICGALGLGVNYREFTVPSGAAGTTQTYRAQFSSSPKGFNGVCVTDTFTFSGKTIRTNSSGTYESAWSNPQRLYPEF